MVLGIPITARHHPERHRARPCGFEAHLDAGACFETVFSKTIRSTRKNLSADDKKMNSATMSAQPNPACSGKPDRRSLEIGQQRSGGDGRPRHLPLRKAPEGWRTPRRFAQFGSHRETRQRPGLRWPSTAFHSARRATVSRCLRTVTSFRPRKIRSLLKRRSRCEAQTLRQRIRTGSNPSAQGWRNAPTLGNRPHPFINSEGVASNPPHPAKTPSELFSLLNRNPA